MTARSKATGPAWVVQLQPGPHPVWVAAESGLASTMYYQFAYRFESEMDAIVALQAAETHGEFPLAEVYRQVPKPSATGALLCAELEGDIAPNVELRDVQLNAEIQPAHDTALCSCGAPLQPALYADGITMPTEVIRMAVTRAEDLRVVRCLSSGAEFTVPEVRAMQAWWSAGAHEQKLWMQQQAKPRDMATGGATPAGSSVTPAGEWLDADGAPTSPSVLDAIAYAEGWLHEDTPEGRAVCDVLRDMMEGMVWREVGNVPTEPGKYWLFDGSRVTLAERDGEGWSIDTASARGYMPGDLMVEQALVSGWRFCAAIIPEPPR